MSRVYMTGGPFARILVTKPGYNADAPSIPYEGVALSSDLQGVGTLYLSGVWYASSHNNVVASWPALPFIPVVRVVGVDEYSASELANFMWRQISVFNNRIEVESWAGFDRLYYYVFMKRFS